MKKKFSVFLSNVGTCSDRYCSQYATPFSIRELFQRAASIKELEPNPDYDPENPLFNTFKENRKQSAR